jgi:carbonic anhydrase
MRAHITSVALFLASAVCTGAAAYVLRPHAQASESTEEAAPSTDEVRRWMFGGNAMFAAGANEMVDVDPARRTEIATGQKPWCTVLTCADSRVPPEHLFHAGLGRVFTVRVAGNVAEAATIASVEYATEHLHTPLVMVLGHERCGAVTAAMSTGSLTPFLDELLGQIRPGIVGITDLDQAIEANVVAQLARLRKSEVITHLEHEGKIQLVGAIYDLDTGLVRPVGAPQPAAHH